MDSANVQLDEDEQILVLDPHHQPASTDDNQTQANSNSTWKSTSSIQQQPSELIFSLLPKAGFETKVLLDNMPTEKAGLYSTNPETALLHLSKAGFYPLGDKSNTPLISLGTKSMPFFKTDNRLYMGIHEPLTLPKGTTHSVLEMQGSLYAKDMEGDYFKLPNVVEVWKAGSSFLAQTTITQPSANVEQHLAYRFSYKVLFTIKIKTTLPPSTLSSASTSTSSALPALIHPSSPPSLSSTSFASPLSPIYNAPVGAPSAPFHSTTTTPVSPQTMKRATPSKKGHIPFTGSFSLETPYMHDSSTSPNLPTISPCSSSTASVSFIQCGSTTDSLSPASASQDAILALTSSAPSSFSPSFPLSTFPPSAPPASQTISPSAASPFSSVISIAPSTAPLVLSQKPLNCISTFYFTTPDFQILLKSTYSSLSLSALTKGRIEFKGETEKAQRKQNENNAAETRYRDTMPANHDKRIKVEERDGTKATSHESMSPEELRLRAEIVDMKSRFETELLGKDLENMKLQRELWEEKRQRREEKEELKRVEAERDRLKERGMKLERHLTNLRHIVKEFCDQVGTADALLVKWRSMETTGQQVEEAGDEAGEEDEDEDEAGEEEGERESHMRMMASGWDQTRRRSDREEAKVMSCLWCMTRMRPPADEQQTARTTAK